MKRKKSVLGISLLEVLISISVLVIIGTILMYAFGNFRSAQSLSESQIFIIGMIKDARARTIASNQNSNYGVHFEADKTVLFKGNSYNPSDSSNELYVLPQAVRINAISLTGGAVNAVFTRLYGTTTASGTISIQSLRDNTTRIITLEPTGTVK